MAERALELAAMRAVKNLIRFLRKPGCALGFVEVASNEEFKGVLTLTGNGRWRVTSNTAKGYRNIQTSRKKNLDEILEVFALLTDPRMERYVGPAFLYDDDWEMYHKRRREYLEVNKREILVAFISVLRQRLIELIQVHSASTQ